MPPYWLEFLATFSLVGREVSIPEPDDRSGVGAEIEFLDEAGSREEAEEYYPGIAVAADGFVPVGSCLIGTGDPYFIRLADGEGGPLYRVDHEAVGKEGYDRAAAVDVVLDDYRHLLRYLKA